MSLHAILGSRDYPDLDQVIHRVQLLHARHGHRWILVSGGSRGVCQTAEAAHLARGGRVISLRPVRRPAQAGERCFGADEWRLQPGLPPEKICHPLEWLSFRDAAMWRSMLIAERAEHGDMFWDGRSFGSAMEIDFFAAAGTPLKIYGR